MPRRHSRTDPGPVCIGFFRVDLFLPGAASLKDKRQVLRRLKDRLSGRHNLSIAEIDHQDLWQRSRLGMVMIGTERAVLDRSLQGVRAEIERLVPGAVVDFSVEYLA